MENIKSHSISDPESKTSQHLTLDSSPRSPSSQSSTTNSSQLKTRSPPATSPADSSVHLTIVSGPESPRRGNSNTKETKQTPPSAKSPVESPARSSVSSGHITFTHGSSPREEKASESPPGNSPEQTPAPESVVGRPMGTIGERGKVEGGGRGGSSYGGSGRRTRQSLSILRSAKRENMVKRAALGLRVSGCLFCLVSFSVIAADRNMGWALDSFYRYKEFRYSMTVNAIGFTYSAVQAVDLAYHRATGKALVQHPLRYSFDLAVDQMISYLLISASSSAATRIDDWISNWGKDKFPDMATASVTMSFLAFVALAFSSLISGYNLCISKSLQL